MLCAQPGSAPGYHRDTGILDEPEGRRRTDEPLAADTPSGAIAGVLFALLLAAALALIRLATPSDAGDAGAWLAG